MGCAFNSVEAAEASTVTHTKIALTIVVVVLLVGADSKDDVKQAPPSPKLERALWSVWLGTKPVSIDLRRALLERLDTLGR